MLLTVTGKQVLEAWRRGGASRERLLVKLSQDDVSAWVQQLLPGPPEARRLAASLLSRSPHHADALPQLRSLAADDDRYTREAAAHSTGELLKRHFDEVYPILGTWRTEPSTFVRRATVLAAGVAADPVRLDLAEPLLRLLDPLLRDRSPEVRTALEGVLGRAFLTAYPDDLFQQLTAWSASHEEGVLQHVAQALGKAPPALIRKALIVLRHLALDERKPVRGAVVRALAELARSAPEPVLAELRRWLPDEDRAPVARAALGRL